MKFIIASDIHGSAKYCKVLIDVFNREEADKLLLLGDILYHGPRNNLPDGYNPKEVIELLNAINNKILSVRGNCDTEVDQMVLKFPVLADYAIIPCGERTIFATHGHHYNPENLPPLNRGDILLNGHTHVTAWQERGDFLYFNPGSVSIPKENTERGYIVFEDTTFTWKTLSGEELKKIIL